MQSKKIEELIIDSKVNDSTTSFEVKEHLFTEEEDDTNCDLFGSELVITKEDFDGSVHLSLWLGDVSHLIALRDMLNRSIDKFGK